MNELPSSRTGGLPPPPGRKSRLIAIGLTVVCGALLALGSCFGLLVGMNSPKKPINTLFTWGMIAGAVAFLAGIVWGIVALVLHLLRSRSQRP